MKRSRSINSPIRILILDDGSIIKKDEEASIPDRIFSFTTCKNREEALKILAEKEFDAIISEIKTPSYDGLTLLKKIRAENIKIPVIFFTENKNPEILAEAINSGASGYYIKRSPHQEITEEILEKVIESAGKTRYTESNISLISAVLDAVPGGIIASDTITKKFVFANEAICRTLGYSRDEILRLSLADIHPAWDMERVSGLFMDMTSGKADFAREVPVQRKDGTIFYADIRGSEIELNGRKTAIALFSDVTERTEAEKALDRKKEELDTSEEKIIQQLHQLSDAQEMFRESEGQFKHVIENIPISLSIVTLEGDVVYANPKAHELFGLNPDGSNYRGGAPVVWKEPSGRKLWLDGIRKNGVISGLQADFTTFSGEEKTLLLSGMKINYKNQPCVLSVHQDITDRILAEKALKETTDAFRTYIDNSYDAVLIHDTEGRIVDVNKKMLAMYGVTYEEALNHTIRDYSAPNKNMDDVRKIWRDVMAGNNRIFFWQARRPHDGSLFNVEVFLTRIELDNRTFVLANVRDITERKKAEKALYLANRKLKLLSSVTRHDILNQIMVFFGNLEFAIEDCTDENITEYLRKMKKAVMSIQHQIEFTKEYDDLGSKAPVWFSPGSLTFKDTNGIIPVKNEILDVEIFADPMIDLAFNNLYDNAVRHAEGATGIRITGRPDNEDYIIIFEDDGCGILDEMKEKIFERNVGKNTGLGLFLIREILSITGITIRENGNLKEGARFEMRLPKGVWRMRGDSHS
ncbi:PAS domain S-box protein [Methanoplanus limicola]|uniref:histidine kinase n=1 Tax=Methanoplanus limicola DSM 2279 TaxID=937775 RepID=H1Z0R8_9EURY|nr:PAS domain S-box protein [Methanoplanus limicola]EHQ36211.1 multi-sensor signal transduction histidine kinase [Methanoplanus limicola DSM 2279]